MIVLDANVISEMMRSEPNPTVFDWVAGQPRSTLFTTSITQIEVVYGIAALPAGRRRDALALAADAILLRNLRVGSCRSRAARRRTTPKSCSPGASLASRSKGLTR